MREMLYFPRYFYRSEMHIDVELIGSLRKYLQLHLNDHIKALCKEQNTVREKWYGIIDRRHVHAANQGLCCSIARFQN